MDTGSINQEARVSKEVIQATLRQNDLDWNETMNILAREWEYQEIVRISNHLTKLNTIRHKLNGYN